MLKHVIFLLICPFGSLEAMHYRIYGPVFRHEQRDPEKTTISFSAPVKNIFSNQSYFGQVTQELLVPYNLLINKGVLTGLLISHTQTNNGTERTQEILSMHNTYELFTSLSNVLALQKNDIHNKK